MEKKATTGRSSSKLRRGFQKGFIPFDHCKHERSDWLL